MAAYGSQTVLLQGAIVKSRVRSRIILSANLLHKTYMTDETQMPADMPATDMPAAEPTTETAPAPEQAAE